MKNDAFWTRIIYVISVVISLVVAFLILGPRPDGIEGSIDVSMLPFVNATLNSITAILLIIGYMFIRSKNIKAHKIVMLTSFGTSSLFLASYVIYHWFKSGPKAYLGDYQTLYYFILISHILLAAIIIPLALFTLTGAGTIRLKSIGKLLDNTSYLVVCFCHGVIIYSMLY